MEKLKFISLSGLCVFPQSSDVQAVLCSATNLHGLMLVKTPTPILPELGRSFQIESFVKTLSPFLLSRMDRRVHMFFFMVAIFFLPLILQNSENNQKFLKCQNIGHNIWLFKTLITPRYWEWGNNRVVIPSRTKRLWKQTWSNPVACSCDGRISCTALPGYRLLSNVHMVNDLILICFSEHGTVYIAGWSQMHKAIALKAFSLSRKIN